MTTPPVASAPVPPPPDYAPTVGLVTTWWTNPVRATAQTLAAAPTASDIADARKERAKAKTEKRAEAGTRHVRARRWLLINALSASGGYALGLVQWCAHLPRPVVAFAMAGVYAFELFKIRRREDGFVNLSQARGTPAFWLMVAVRVPFASGLAALLGLAPLFALTDHVF